MYEAVTVPRVVMMNSTGSEESLARDTETHTTETHRQTDPSSSMLTFSKS